MDNIQKQVNDVCLLADKVIENPSTPVSSKALELGLSVSIVNPIAGVLTYLWLKHKDRERKQQEKERMLREVIRKQQAVIRALEQQQASNRREIENLKRMLAILKEVESNIKAA